MPRILDTSRTSSPIRPGPVWIRMYAFMSDLPGARRPRAAYGGCVSRRSRPGELLVNVPPPPPSRTRRRAPSSAELSSLRVPGGARTDRPALMRRWTDSHPDASVPVAHGHTGDGPVGHLERLHRPIGLGDPGQHAVPMADPDGPQAHREVRGIHPDVERSGDGEGLG